MQSYRVRRVGIRRPAREERDILCRLNDIGVFNIGVFGVVLRGVPAREGVAVARWNFKPLYFSVGNACRREEVIVFNHERVILKRCCRRVSGVVHIVKVDCNFASNVVDDYGVVFVAHCAGNNCLIWILKFVAVYFWRLNAVFFAIVEITRCRTYEVALVMHSVLFTIAILNRQRVLIDFPLSRKFHIAIEGAMKISQTALKVISIQYLTAEYARPNAVAGYLKAD